MATDTTYVGGKNLPMKIEFYSKSTYKTLSWLIIFLFLVWMYIYMFLSIKLGGNKFR